MKKPGFSVNFLLGMVFFFPIGYRLYRLWDHLYGPKLSKKKESQRRIRRIGGVLNEKRNDGQISDFG